MKVVLAGHNVDRDVLGLSRLAIEELERFRLASFTEKSQRYITLGDDFVVPEEIAASGGRELFVETLRAQNALYHRLYDRLKPYVFDKNPELAANPRKHAVLDGWAKEDARYAVSLATEGQLGLTVNARTLELMIRRFAAKPSAEVRELGRKLYETARDVAPSILLFTEATDFDAQTYGALAAAAENIGPGAERAGSPPSEGEPVRLLGFTPDGDDRILASILHSVASKDFLDGWAEVKSLSPRRKKKLMKTAFERMEFHDFPLREFEQADLAFELVLSASAFAQLKRHRMATLTAQSYDPALGVTVPSSIIAVGLKGEFREVIARTETAHRDLWKIVGPAADYVLANAHRRRCLLKVNLRELYHISRLREDASAQWEIRRLAGKMSVLARRVMPLAGLLLGGKDAFPARYRRVFGRPPKLVPPRPQEINP
ncbi:MAG: FAD-dependent thymidylate synthase [Candidatus Aminicenantes bacterium]|nr:FAD-dependent thymidylate synthase [Candidatus Aminicenantes bacterium]